MCTTLVCRSVFETREIPLFMHGLCTMLQNGHFRGLLGLVATIFTELRSKITIFSMAIEERLPDSAVVKLHH